MKSLNLYLLTFLITFSSYADATILCESVDGRRGHVQEFIIWDGGYFNVKTNIKSFSLAGYTVKTDDGGTIYGTSDITAHGSQSENIIKIRQDSITLKYSAYTIDAMLKMTIDMNDEVSPRIFSAKLEVYRGYYDHDYLAGDYIEYLCDVHPDLI